MSDSNTPVHVGIIMDGNGRWAKKRGLPRIAGHNQGANTFYNIAKHVSKTPVKYLTVYAFSTENWKRPRDEVNGIMDLLRGFLKQADKYMKENMRLVVIGDLIRLDEDIRGNIREIEEKTKNADGLTLVIALNYGGRNDILEAAKTLARLYAKGKIEDLDDIDESKFSKYLYTADMPEVDLVIRTSGEMRVSNFMLWQSAYAEYVFTNILWPDFRPKHFDAAILEYSKRVRRLGNVDCS